MKPLDVHLDIFPEQTLGEMLATLHRTGPVTQAQLEALSLYKEFAPKAFGDVEKDVLAAMGLFYKVDDPDSLYAFLMRQIGEANRTARGELLTPVQASMRRAIADHQFVSISAPTSAGKSYSIRDFISSGDGDAVIVVPSRALIAEYVAALKKYFDGNKTVMILPFVDSVFRKRDLRRIFVLTPERAREIFEKGDKIDVRVFFFDEAQVSDEDRRGVVFDVLVRRVSLLFPSAKLIFAHPFVENPEAQFSKHRLSKEGAFARAYPQGAVGKIFVQRHGNQKDYYFSPFETDGHIIGNCVEFPGGFASFALDGKKSILVYVSKRSIYTGEFTKDFEQFIDLLPAIKDDDALEIISAIKDILGADNHDHKSKMIDLMKRGVVIHHGSVPLEVRFLVEDFIRSGHAKLCFATSTLAQGVNMPFDIVWLNTMKILGGDERKRSLSFKNLIGRAGRLTAGGTYDYGYVYTKNPKLLASHVNQEYKLSDVSVLDAGEDEVPRDVFDIVDAIRDGSFDDELHLPRSRLDRLTAPSVIVEMQRILDVLYPEGELAVSDIRGRDSASTRDALKASFKAVYEAYLDRPLVDGEHAVFREAISIMLSTFAGRTFREIAGTRFSRISRRDEKSASMAAFSQAAADLPDAKLIKPYSVFDRGTKKGDVSYDVVVFDTYDYLDKVIAFCLSDVFAAASRMYFDQMKDDRALKLIELLRFGTNDSMHVLMMRYGFLPDQIEVVLPYVLRLNEDEIVFRKSLRFASEEIRQAVDWYM